MPSSINNRQKRLTDTSTWAAATDLAAVNLPRDGQITEVTIRANTTATLTATALDDWFRRLIQNIRVEGEGIAFLGMSGVQMSTMLSLWHETLTGAPTLHSNGAGIALAGPDVGSATFISVFKWHPGSNPNDPFDLSAVIPAKALSSLQIKLTTPASGVADPNGLVTAGTFTYEVNHVLNTRPHMAQKVPVGFTETYTHTGNLTDFGRKQEVPGGNWLRSILIRVLDDTGTPAQRRKDDEVTGISLERSLSSDRLIEANIFEVKQAMAARYGLRGIAGEVGPIGAIATIRPSPVALLNMAPAGWYLIDLRPYGHPLYGLDLRPPYKTGDLKLGLTIANYAAGDATTIYWDQLQDMRPEWVNNW